MAKREKKTTRPITEAIWKKMHDAFVNAPKNYETGRRLTLRELCRRFRVSFREADALLWEPWQVERGANDAERWLAEHGMGARNKHDFVLLFAVHEYGHLMRQGPEGYRLAMAHAEELWTRVTAPRAEWLAHCELEAAKEAYDAVRPERMKYPSSKIRIVYTDGHGEEKAGGTADVRGAAHA